MFSWFARTGPNQAKFWDGLEIRSGKLNAAYRAPWADTDRFAEFKDAPDINRKQAHDATLAFASESRVPAPRLQPADR